MTTAKIHTESSQVNAAVPLSHLPAEGYLRQAQITPGIIPFSATTLWRKVRGGTFPKPVKLSERVTAWRVGDLRNWLIAQQDQE